jgi:hypothetical protein
MGHATQAILEKPFRDKEKYSAASLIGFHNIA